MHRYFQINAQGHNIRCKLYYQDLAEIRHLVIFCHGFGGHKDNAAAEKFADRLLSKHKGAALLTFNWPCHGDDVKKKLTLSDCDAYLGLVITHVKEKYSPAALYAYATSFGGYLTLKYMADHGSPFRRVALRCPAVDMHRVLTTTIAEEADLVKLRRGKEIPLGFDRKILIGQAFLEELRENDIRKVDFLDWAEDILILHGTTDEIVPFEDSKTFADENLMEFLPVEGADHRFRDPKKMDRAIKAILDFYDISE